MSFVKAAFKWSCTLALVAGLCAGCAELQNGNLAGDILRTMQTSPGIGLDEQTVAAGLKEALQVGSERAVGLTSSPNGFWANELIRIAMPSELEPMAKTLRTIGFDRQVDQFEMGMNRAAEKASGEAKAVFWDAISGMTLTDAMGILNGGETAATDYFKARTSDTLRSRFQPIVQEKMSQVGLYQNYQQLMGAYTALPLVNQPSFDLDGYIADQGLDGLYTMLAQEEQRIRQNPAARTTELLQRVFAGK